MQEKTELVKNPETGKREKVTRMVYEWEDGMQDAYRLSMAKAMAKYLEQALADPGALVPPTHATPRGCRTAAPSAKSLLRQHPGWARHFLGAVSRRCASFWAQSLNIGE
eukprot:EG_transcript_8941